MGAFLPVSALPGLKNYKYASEDRSRVSKYVLKPFYVTVVEYLPRWLAPNMITTLGLVFSIVSFFRAWYYSSEFVSFNTPRWVYFAHAFDLFMYQTLDALDGQQARRTGSSSPLGELFDHCVDAINTSLQAYVVASVLDLPKSLALMAQFACTVNFFLSTWEEYHTHKLFLSVFSGPVEGILMLVAAEILTGIFGPQLWFKEVSVFGSEYIIRDIGVIGLVLGLVMNCITAVSNVHKAVKTRFATALCGIVPFAAMYAGFWGWAYVSWQTVKHTGFMPFFLGIGSTFSLLVGRIITAHVTSQPYPMWTPLLATPYVGIFLHYLAPENDLQVMWAALGLSIGIYGTFVAEIINSITEYLDIGCFYIKHKVKTD